MKKIFSLAVVTLTVSIAAAPALAQERLQRFMAHQAAISQERLQEKVGQVQQVLVDAVEDDLATARSMADAPEIDGLVHVQQVAHGVRPGDFLNVRIEAADEHDLFARPLETGVESA